MVLVSSGEQITSLILLTHATPQVLETLSPPPRPHMFSQMLKQDGKALRFDSFERAQLHKVLGTLILKLYFLT